MSSKIAEKIERIKAELNNIGLEMGQIDRETVDHIRNNEKNEMAAQIDGEVGVEYQVWSLAEQDHYGFRFVILELPVDASDARIMYAGGDYVFALAFIVGEIAKKYVS